MSIILAAAHDVLSAVLEGSATAIVTHKEDTQSVSLYTLGGISLPSMAAAEAFVHTQLQLSVDAESRRSLTHVTRSLCFNGKQVPAPAPPVFATLTLMSDRLYLFGGNADQWTNALFSFDLVTEEWSRVICVGHSGPSPRDKHCAVALDSHQLVIFGGFGPGGNELLTDNDDDDDEDSEDDGDDSDEIDRLSRQHKRRQHRQSAAAACFTWFNDLFVFDTEKKNWCERSCRNQLRPTPRAAATLTRMKQGLILFGGRDAAGRCNDVFCYDSATSSWTSLSTVGTLPAPRSFHAACALPDGLSLAVSGGRLADDSLAADLHILNVTTNNWTRIELNSGALGRVCHVLFVLSDWLIEGGGAMDYDPDTMICQQNAPHCTVYCLKTFFSTTTHSEEEAKGESSPKKLRLNDEPHLGIVDVEETIGNTLEKEC